MRNLFNVELCKTKSEGCSRSDFLFQAAEEKPLTNFFFVCIMVDNHQPKRN